MSYAIVIEDEAAALIRSLTVDEFDEVFEAIDRLALDPTGLSRPGTFPHTGFQVYAFKIKIGGVEREITIPFHYSQDEQSIHILRILIDPNST